MATSSSTHQAEEAPTATPSAPNRLCFGVELEMLVPVIQNNVGQVLVTSRYLPIRNQDCIGILIEKMQADGFPTIDYDVEHEFAKWNVTTDESVDVIGEWDFVRETGTFSCFEDRMTNALANMQPLPEYLRERVEFMSIEIKTPKLLFTEDNIAYLRRFMEFLNEKIPAGVNRTCGLHVHIGHEDITQPNWQLSELKNLLQAVIAGEFHLGLLHPDARTLDSHFCTMNSRVFDPEIRNNRAEMALKIERCQTKDAFVRLATIQWGDRWPDRYFAYNFVPLGRNDECIKTVEFRLHRGSISVGEVITWTRFCASLVQKCKEMSVPPGGLLTLKPYHTTWDMLEMLGLGDFVGKLPTYDRTWSQYTRVRDQVDQRIMDDDNSPVPTNIPSDRTDNPEELPARRLKTDERIARWIDSQYVADPRPRRYELRPRNSSRRRSRSPSRTDANDN